MPDERDEISRERVEAAKALFDLFVSAVMKTQDEADAAHQKLSDAVAELRRRGVIQDGPTRFEIVREEEG